MMSITSTSSISSNTSKLHSKQELINLILIEFKDYRWTIDDDDEMLKHYEDPQLCIVHITNDYKFYVNINDTWERSKKRIYMEMNRQTKEKCRVCNEIQKLLFCDECLNQHCYFCHAHIVIKNMGTPVCPFCKDGEDKININTPFNNTLRKNRYEFALKLIESK